jgi:hypothetical protein
MDGIADTLALPGSPSLPRTAERERNRPLTCLVPLAPVPLPAETPVAVPVERWHVPWWLWLPALAFLFLLQGWLTLSLFGPDPVVNLLNDQPIMSGNYAQHYYLAGVGARALLARGNDCAYDAAFQAGYPKTPIFDGSRLGEVFLLLGGGSSQPAAYKLGLAGCCLLVPLLLLVACLGAGLDRAATLLAVFVGQVVWWGPLGRGALEAADSELYLAALAGLAHVGLLISFHRTGSILAWVGLWLTGCLGWFLEPLLFPIALPLLLAYYLSVGPRHDLLTWHLAFWLAELAALVVNGGWLLDWANYWWLRAPLPTATAVLQHRTLGTVWNAGLWGGPADRLLTIVLMSAATVGVLILNQTQQRCTARLLGMGAGGALVLALLGISWEPLGLVGTAALLAPALWFAALPAAHAWTFLCRLPCRYQCPGRLVSLCLLSAPALALVLPWDAGASFLSRCVQARPLTIGLSAQRNELVKTLVAQTRADARILWEDRALARQASRWTALLPSLTGRPFIGGLDPDMFLEHSSICLANENLDGRPIGNWSDEDLADYCRRYNVGWVVAWTTPVIERFQQWDGAEPAGVLRDDQEGKLFHVKQAPFGFTLKGRADVLQADSRYIILGDVIPENGVVVLSLHYQAGMRASPGRVDVEREPTGDDPIGFIRLRLAKPAKRVTLTWDR